MALEERAEKREGKGKGVFRTYPRGNQAVEELKLDFNELPKSLRGKWEL